MSVMRCVLAARDPTRAPCSVVLAAQRRPERPSSRQSRSAANRRAHTSKQASEQKNMMPNNTWVHLSVLRNAGHVYSAKDGRNVTYFAQRATIVTPAKFLGDVVS
jgi:hypothetical protein